MSQRWIKKTNYIKRHGKRRARSVELPCAKHIKITPWQFHLKEFGNTKIMFNCINFNLNPPFCTCNLKGGNDQRTRDV